MNDGDLCSRATTPNNNYNNTNNTNTSDNSAVIMAKPLRRVHSVHSMNADLVSSSPSNQANRLRLCVRLYSFYHPAEGIRLSQPRWLASYTEWFTHPRTVTHPGTNRARRRETTLIDTNTLSLCHVSTLCLHLSHEPSERHRSIVARSMDDCANERSTGSANPSIALDTVDV